MGLFDFLKKNKNIENDNGLNETYYDNGKGVLFEKFYKKNGKLDGLYEFYDVCIISGHHHLSRIGKFKNGQKDGVWKEYGYKGKGLHKVGEFKNGQKDGVWKKWGGDELIGEVNYKEGMLHGISISIDALRVGKIYSKSVYLNKYKNGEILEKKSYGFVKADKNEIILGELEWETFFENGKWIKRNN